MKINGTNDIQGVDRASGRDEVRPQTATDGTRAGDTVTDKVTIQGQRLSDVLDSVRQKGDANRSARLSELESQIKSGTYRPDAGQLAEKLLSAAEVDARLRAMLQG